VNRLWAMLRWPEVLAVSTRVVRAVWALRSLGALPALQQLQRRLGTQRRRSRATPTPQGMWATPPPLRMQWARWALSQIQKLTSEAVPLRLAMPLMLQKLQKLQHLR